MTVLVTGASGKVGRRVVDALTRRGRTVRPGSRRSAVRLDWADPATWQRALDGVESVFLVVPGGDDGHRSVAGLGERVVSFVEAAESAGVGKVVLMTALGMQYAPAEVEQRAVELRLMAGTMSWTVLRPNWFFQNLTEGPLRTLAEAADGTLRVPCGDAAVSFIDARDIADAAAEALLGAHEGREYDLTGAESLTFTEVAGRCARAALPIRGYEPVDDEEFRQVAASLGWDGEYTDTVSGLFAAIASGAAAEVIGDLPALLGRRAYHLDDFLLGLPRE
jgi:uncharacterized protein YbjT (DUF2867 family)